MATVASASGIQHRHGRGTSNAYGGLGGGRRPNPDVLERRRTHGADRFGGGGRSEIPELVSDDDRSRRSTEERDKWVIDRDPLALPVEVRRAILRNESASYSDEPTGFIADGATLHVLDEKIAELLGARKGAPIASHWERTDPFARHDEVAIRIG